MSYVNKPEKDTRNLPTQEEINRLDIEDLKEWKEKLEGSTHKMQIDMEDRDADPEWKKSVRTAYSYHSLCLKRMNKRISEVSKQPSKLNGKSVEDIVIRLEKKAQGLKELENNLKGKEINIKNRILQHIEYVDFGRVFYNVAEKKLSPEIFEDLVHYTKQELTERIRSKIDV